MKTLTGKPRRQKRALERLLALPTPTPKQQQEIDVLRARLGC